MKINKIYSQGGNQVLERDKPKTKIIGNIILHSISFSFGFLMTCVIGTMAHFINWIPLKLSEIYFIIRIGIIVGLMMNILTFIYREK